MGSEPQRQSRPTLEDLLRFKRFERPPPEFWAEFDRGLRQKQLAALMKKPTGWAKWSPFVVRGLRWTVPAAATAAAVFVVVQAPFTAVSRQHPVEVASVAVRGVQPELQTEPVGRDSMVVSAELAAGGSVSPSVAAPVYDVGSLQSPVVADSQRTSGVVAATVPPAFTDGPAEQLAATLTPTRSFVRDERRFLSSWTSRYSSLAQEIAAPLPERTLELVSYSPPSGGVSSTTRRLAVTDQSLVASVRTGREPDERLIRSLEARLGSSNSRGLSIKF